MWKNPSRISRFLMVAGLTVSWLTLAGTGNAMSAQDDEDEKVEKVEKEEKKKKRKIRIVRSGDSSVTVARPGHHSVIASSHDGFLKSAKQREEALEKAQAALEEVTKRLKKARGKSEKAALKAAQEGLSAAIEMLEKQSMHHMVMGPSRVEIARIEADVMRDTLKDLEIREGELATMRVEIEDQLDDAREQIDEAVGQLDLEIDMDGDIRTLRFRSLKSAEQSLEKMEKRHLEALKHAEEEIRRERERLEKKLEKQEKDAEAKKD